MDTNKKGADRKMILSTLWIFASVNYIFCDVVSNMEPAVIRELSSGTVGGIPVNQEFLLGAGIMLEIPFVMIVLSRVLKYGANRWVNVIAGLAMTLIQISSFFVGSALTLHYIFFSVVEIAADLLVVWLALKWRDPAKAEAARAS